MGAQLSRGPAPLPVAPGPRAAYEPIDTMTATSPGPIVLWLSSRYENIELAQAALWRTSAGSAGSTPRWSTGSGWPSGRRVANAVKHGNRLDPEKRVLVKLDGAGDDLTIVVGDEGSGFDPERISDPLAPENQMKTSGRGIFYIRTFMDDVAFSRGERGRDRPDDAKGPQQTREREGRERMNKNASIRKIGDITLVELKGKITIGAGRPPDAGGDPRRPERGDAASSSSTCRASRRSTPPASASSSAASRPRPTRGRR